MNELKNIGFNVNYKWVEGFIYEGSPQFTGSVPTGKKILHAAAERRRKSSWCICLSVGQRLTNSIF